VASGRLAHVEGLDERRRPERARALDQEPRLGDVRFVVVGRNRRASRLEELAVAHRSVADERLTGHVELVRLAGSRPDGEHLSTLRIEHGRPTPQGVERRRTGHRQVERERE
jgi:hypothetical protein